MNGETPDTGDGLRRPSLKAVLRHCRKRGSLSARERSSRLPLSPASGGVLPRRGGARVPPGRHHRAKHGRRKRAGAGCKGLGRPLRPRSIHEARRACRLRGLERPIGPQLRNLRSKPGAVETQRANLFPLLIQDLLARLPLLAQLGNQPSGFVFGPSKWDAAYPICLPGAAFDACSMLWCSHGLGLFALEVHELSGNGFRNGLQQALHVLQLWPSFIQPVSSQRRQSGSLHGGGAAVLTIATCLLVSSLRLPRKS